MGSNNINIEPPVVVNLAGTPATHTSQVFEIKDYTTFIVDVVMQLIGAVTTTVQIRAQQSDDGVLWHDPTFVSTLTATVAVPRPRTQVAVTPGRKFGRVLFSATTAPATNLDYTVLRKTNA
jgi:hypothetical protein